MIALSIGDPSVFGNMSPASSVQAALTAQITKHTEAGGASRHGYPPSTGYAFARAAVAQRFATAAAPLTENDVILASGCSGALELVMAALANPGDNILVPEPGFSLYLTICGNKGFEARHYPLMPAAEWQVDTVRLEALIDTHTKAIIINNPSNPCGSVYSRAHLEAIVAIARRHRVPLIADEVYANMVFAGQTFVPLADVCGDVPCFSVGGVAKQVRVPISNIFCACCCVRGSSQYVQLHSRLNLSFLNSFLLRRVHSTWYRVGDWAGRSCTIRMRTPRVPNKRSCNCRK